MAAGKVSSLDEVRELISTHGEIEGVRVYISKRIEAMREGKEMSELLKGMIKGCKGWDVPDIEALAKLERIHDNLSAADSIIDDLIRRTDPAVVRARRRQAGVRVATTIRVPALDAASSRRRNERAGSPATASRNSPTRRRPASPAPIPFHATKKLSCAGKRLGKACLYVVQELGEDVAKIIPKLKRVKWEEDIGNIRTSLIELKKKLNRVWASEVRLKDLKVKFA